MSKTGYFMLNSDMLKIGFLLYENCLAAGALSGKECFTAANALAGGEMFNFKLLSAKKTASLPAAHGIVLAPEKTVGAFKPDILILPGFWAHQPEEAFAFAKSNGKVARLLESLPPRTLVCSYCAGSLFHALSGRLKNKEATATWWLAPPLKGAFPNVLWRFEKKFMRDGFDSTSSGANGFRFIYETLIKDAGGQELLDAVRTYLVAPLLNDISDPFAHLAAVTTDALTRKIKESVERTDANNISTDAVATALGLSSKTLYRKLKARGLTPGRFFKLIKHRQAARLLVYSEAPVAEISHELGFTDEFSFRKSFKAVSSMTPGQYRKRFGKF